RDGVAVRVGVVVADCVEVGVAVRVRVDVAVVSGVGVGVRFDLGAACPGVADRQTRSTQPMCVDGRAVMEAGLLFPALILSMPFSHDIEEQGRLFLQNFLIDSGNAAVQCCQGDSPAPTAATEWADGRGSRMRILASSLLVVATLAAVATPAP